MTLNNTGHTQTNGAVLIVKTIKIAPFFCVCPVYRELYNEFVLFSVFKNVYVFMLRLVARARNDVLRNCALEIARYIIIIIIIIIIITVGHRFDGLRI
jgi:hypothetical protein